MFLADREPTGFPTLNVDIDDDFRSQSGTAKRVCIATAEIDGVAGSGSTGIACLHLAQHLAEWGHDVVIAYVNEKAANMQLVEEARALHARYDIAFEPIPPRRFGDSVREQVSAPTLTLLDWVRARERPFDVVHVSERRGLGYGPLLAKSLGMDFGSTHFVVSGSGPLLWLAEANRRFLSSEYELGLVFLEKRSVELADTVVCGSTHLLEWMHSAGYAVPARSFVWPNLPLIADPLSAEAAEAAECESRDGARLEEVVFLGHLAPSIGLVLFVDAIDRLVSQGRAPERVTFLGSPVGLFDGPGLIRARSRNWPINVSIVTSLGPREAVTYLSRPGRLAVIPPLLENSSIAVMECLQAGIPFVAAAAGETPEFVAAGDHSRALVAPDHIALGERIADLAGASLRAVRPRWDLGRTLEVWERWHAQTASFGAHSERFTERERAVDTGSPLVTICIVHYERHELVRMAVDSVFAQDYPAVDAVLVDDGSESVEAHATLDAIEPDFLHRGWRVIRQENCYLGAARNAAASAARGEWLLFLDDDNVLFSDAVSRLVRAARFSGADCITAAGVRFTGEGDPRSDTTSHLSPIRFFGAALASNLFRNVIGDACALVRRAAFEAVGGFEKERGFALSDMSFFNTLTQAGYRVEYMPDTTFYKRVLPASMIRSADRSSAGHRHFVTMPYLSGLSAEERALASLAIGRIDQSGVPKRLAESAMRRGNRAAARELWEELRQAFPDDPSGYVGGTVALLEAGCPEEAERLAVEALERFPEYSEAYVQRAEVAMHLEDWAVANEMWAELREIFPYYTSGYVRGVTALIGAGCLEEAEKLAVEAAERFPDRPGGYVQRAEVAMRSEDWESACDRWREVREMFPDHAAGYVRGAEALLAAGRLEEAQGLAVEAVERYPEHSGGYVQRAEAAMRREGWSEAVGYWESVREAFPEEASGYERGTVALMEAGRWEEAEELAGESVTRFPEHSRGYVHRAEAAMRREAWAQAVGYWESVRGVFPDEASGYERGTVALMEAGRWEESEELVGEAVVRFPERRWSYVRRAELAMRREAWAQAVGYWESVRGVFPDEASGYERGTVALMEAGRWEEAEELAGESVTRFPEHSRGYVHRAEARDASRGVGAGGGVLGVGARCVSGRGLGVRARHGCADGGGPVGGVGGACRGSGRAFPRTSLELRTSGRAGDASRGVGAGGGVLGVGTRCVSGRGLGVRARHGCADGGGPVGGVGGACRGSGRAFPRTSLELRTSGGAGDASRGVGAGGGVLGVGARCVSGRGLGVRAHPRLR